MQGRQPNDSNLYAAGLAAVEEITQHLTAIGGSLQSRWELVLILYCNVGSISLQALLATFSSHLVE